MDARPKAPLNLTDEDLLEGLRRADSGSQAELYHRYVGRIAGVIHRVMGSDPELGDLVQETFAQALACLVTFRGSAASLESWLMRVAVFTARSQIRRRHVRRRVVLDEDGEDESNVPAPIATPVHVDALRRTFRVFDLLPSEERIPLALQMIEEMTLPEIAGVCRVSESTVKRRIRRGRRRFEQLAHRDPVLSELLTGWGR